MNRPDKQGKAWRSFKHDCQRLDIRDIYYQYGGHDSPRHSDKVYCPACGKDQCKLYEDTNRGKCFSCEKAFWVVDIVIEYFDSDYRKAVKELIPQIPPGRRMYVEAEIIDDFTPPYQQLKDDYRYVVGLQLWMTLKRIKKTEIIEVLVAEGFKRTTAQNVINGNYARPSSVTWRLGIDTLKKFVCNDPWKIINNFNDDIDKHINERYTPIEIDKFINNNYHYKIK